MPEEFIYDVFLSHSAKDNSVVREIAERLKSAGLRVWFDLWEIGPGDGIPAKIEEGLERSRILVFCMSANAFGPDWAQLEAGTFRFRDPLNKGRRFIPLRLDDAPIKGSLAQFLASSGSRRTTANWSTQSSSGPAGRQLGRLRRRRRRRAFRKTPPNSAPLGSSRPVRLVLMESVFSQVQMTGRCDSGTLNRSAVYSSSKGTQTRVFSVAWSADERRAITASRDETIRLWDIEGERCLLVMEGHTKAVWRVAWSPDQCFALSASFDKTVRLWHVGSGRCLLVLRTNKVKGVAWTADQCHVLAADARGAISLWDISEFVTEARAADTPATALATAPDQVQYTNAKVLLVGESGVGKTGLSKRLALDDWQPSDSTVGAWATQWKLPVSSEDGIEREIWLWDFGGQADQRLIHQLYMEETALAVLVFDGQKEDVFETLGQWDRDITRASRKEFNRLLVAGRTDAGGLRVSRSQVEAFAKERGYTQFLETSAKTNVGCEELKQAILNGIRWENIPWRSSPLLFKRLKEDIVRLKDEGRVLMRFNEMRETLQLRLSGENARFTDEELRAVVNLLAGPAVVWELKFGSWVLLQPERINAYAQAVIQTMRADEHERGCITEERVLNGNLAYHASVERLGADEERFVLLAMHQTLVERGLCLRQQTEKGVLLIFPSYYRRERKELVGAPAVLVSYRFNGFLDDIYATLVVRLHHTDSFERDELWRYAADFKRSQENNSE